jgi:hypothetical protein
VRPDCVMALLRSTDNRPRVHGNGFVQLDVTPCWRLHVWGDPRIPRQKVDTPIHDHTFSFTSYVLLGSLRNVVMVPRQNVSRGHYQPHRATVRRGEDTVLLPFGEPCDLVVLTDMIHSAGTSYRMKAGEVHESFPELGRVSMSLIAKDGPTLAQGGPSPTVFVPVGVAPDNSFDRYAAAPPELLWEIISGAVLEACDRQARSI